MLIVVKTHRSYNSRKLIKYFMVKHSNEILYVQIGGTEIMYLKCLPQCNGSPRTDIRTIYWILAFAVISVLKPTVSENLNVILNVAR